MVTPTIPFTTPEGVPLNPLDVRKRAELPRIQVAARVPCSELTLRLYESSRESVSVKMRRRIDAVYLELSRQNETNRAA